MTPLEQRILDTLKEVGEAPSRFTLLVEAGVPYCQGYYALEALAARGLIDLTPPEKTRRGKAMIVRIRKVETV